MSRATSGPLTLQQARFQFRRETSAENTPSQSASLVDPDTLEVLRDMTRAELKTSQDDIINKLKAFYEAELKIRDDRIEQLIENIDEVEAYSRKILLIDQRSSKKPFRRHRYNSKSNR